MNKSCCCLCCRVCPAPPWMGASRFRLRAAMKTLPIAYCSLFIFREGYSFAFDCLEYLNGLLKSSALPSVSFEELTKVYPPEKIQELYKTICDKVKDCEDPVQTIGMILGQEGVATLGGVVDPDWPMEPHTWDELNIYYVDAATQFNFIAKFMSGDP